MFTTFIDVLEKNSCRLLIEIEAPTLMLICTYHWVVGHYYLVCSLPTYHLLPPPAKGACLHYLGAVSLSSHEVYSANGFWECFFFVFTILLACSITLVHHAAQHNMLQFFISRDFGMNHFINVINCLHCYCG